MKRVITFSMIVIAVLITGCNADYKAELESRIQVLENELSEQKQEMTTLESTLTLKEEQIQVQEIEISRLKNIEESYTELDNKVRMLPSYLKDALSYPEVIWVPKPIDTYLLKKEGWYIGGYKAYTAEEGPCEGAISWTIYETDSVKYIYITNFGCNPKWIGESLYINIGTSLMSISDAISLGYIDEQDLLDSSRIHSESKG